MQAAVRSRFMTKPFKFVSEMQRTAFEINDHQIISRAMEQRLRDVIIERLLPRFKMNNMVWFRHDFPIESKLDPQLDNLFVTDFIADAENHLCMSTSAFDPGIFNHLDARFKECVCQ